MNRNHDKFQNSNKLPMSHEYEMSGAMADLSIDHGDRRHQSHAEKKRRSEGTFLQRVKSGQTPLTNQDYARNKQSNISVSATIRSTEDNQHCGCIRHPSYQQLDCDEIVFPEESSYVSERVMTNASRSRRDNWQFQTNRNEPLQQKESVGGWTKPKRSPYCPDPSKIVPDATRGGFTVARNKYESPYTNCYTRAVEDPTQAKVVEEFIRKENRKYAAQNQAQMQKKNKRRMSSLPESNNSSQSATNILPISRANMDAMEAFLQEIAMARNLQVNQANRNKSCRCDYKDDVNRGSKLLASLPMAGLPTEASQNIERYKPQPYW